MCNSKLLDWLYSDMDDLIDFDEYIKIQEDEIIGDINRKRLSSLGDDSGEPRKYNP